MYLKLAWRNLWRNKRRTLITLSSILFAVVFALFVESLERGAHNQMIDNMAKFHTGYLQIQDYRYENEHSLDNSFYFDEEFESAIISDNRVSYIVPRIETFMLAAGEEITRGAMVFGVDVSAEQKLNDLKGRLSEGRFFEPGDGSVVIGEGLAGRLNLAVGDSLVLLGQGRFGMTAAGLFEIRGLIKHPMREFNNQVVYMSIPDAQWLLSAENHITNLLITPTNLRYTDELARKFSSELEENEIIALTWQNMMPDLIEALDFDRAGTRVFMGILYMVIGFGIFGTILMMTLERLREFGLLLSVGMSRFKLAVVVFIETFAMSILGILSGFGVGSLVLLYFYYNPIELKNDMEELMLEFGFEPVFPMAFEVDIYLWQGMVLFLITMMISLYPTFKIFTLNILDAAKS